MTNEQKAFALRDGASALRYRAERLRGVAGDDNEAANMITQFRLNAVVLDGLAREIEAPA
jgi:hypothetical protein